MTSEFIGSFLPLNTLGHLHLHLHLSILGYVENKCSANGSCLAEKHNLQDNISSQRTVQSFGMRKNTIVKSVCTKSKNIFQRGRMGTCKEISSAYDQNCCESVIYIYISICTRNTGGIYTGHITVRHYSQGPQLHLLFIYD